MLIHHPLGFKHHLLEGAGTDCPHVVAEHPKNNPQVLSQTRSGYSSLTSVLWRIMTPGLWSRNVSDVCVVRDDEKNDADDE